MAKPNNWKVRKSKRKIVGNKKKKKFYKFLSYKDYIKKIQPCH